MASTTANSNRTINMVRGGGLWGVGIIADVPRGWLSDNTYATDDPLSGGGVGVFNGVVDDMGEANEEVEVKVSRVVDILDANDMAVSGRSNININQDTVGELFLDVNIGVEVNGEGGGALNPPLWTQMPILNQRH